jgi:hypothetical protein
MWPATANLPSFISAQWTAMRRCPSRARPMPKAPFFPNGEWIGFFADGKLKKISVRGGEPIVLAEAPNNRGASWGPNGAIIFAATATTGLIRISATGGPRFNASYSVVSGCRIPVLRVVVRGESHISTNDFSRDSASSHCSETKSRYSLTPLIGRGLNSNRFSRPALAL